MIMIMVVLFSSSARFHAFFSIGGQHSLPFCTRYTYLLRFVFVPLGTSCCFAYFFVAHFSFSSYPCFRPPFFTILSTNNPKHKASRSRTRGLRSLRTLTAWRSFMPRKCAWLTRGTSTLSLGWPATTTCTVRRAPGKVHVEWASVARKIKESMIA